ncbi:MAG: hypothetical protein ACLFWD_02005 [Anaerolineales bacterium]
MTARVLLLESEASLRKVVAASLQQSGLEIIQAASPAEARDQFSKNPPAVFVLELDHPARENGQLIEDYREHSGYGSVVLTTTERLQDE